MSSDKKRYERPAIVRQQSGLMNKIAQRASAPPMSEIDGVRIDSLVEEYGSPLFVMSERLIRKNFKQANRVFKTRYPKVQFAWSYKTNYLDAVCQVYHSEGSWAEVVSEFEYDKARRLGVQGKYIIFNGPDKSKAALRKAIQEGSTIHIDHFDELYNIIELTEELSTNARVAIRINMDTGIYPQWDRFGFNFDNGEAWQAINRVLATKRLKLVGLHSHIGTYIMSASAYQVAASKLSSLAKTLRDQHDHKIEYIDMGGGFASRNTLQGQYLPAEGIVPTMEEYADAIITGLLDYAPSPNEAPMLILETGRALIDDTGYLLSTVIANKRLADGRRSMVIDAGVNLLFTSFWFKHKISPVKDPGTVSEDLTIYGPLCMNIDVLREQISMPAMSVGDRMVIHYVGAYDMTQWMQFITLRPNIVMIMEDGSVELIRKAESLDYLLQQEVLPEKLKSATLKK